MSLVGNLEDLGLGEILQIVSLSRKSGILALQSRGREGQIVFRQGQVVRASSSTFQQNLGEVLVRRGVLELPTLRNALRVQEEEGFRERLGTILISRFAISPAAIEEVVREQIETVVYSLFAWVEGSFDFELHESIEVTDNIKMDPLQFMLDQGLNPQFLAMEGSRIIDEMRHRGEFPDDPASPDGQLENSDFDDLAFDVIDMPKTSQIAESRSPVTTPPQAEVAMPATVLPCSTDPHLVHLGDELLLELGEERSAHHGQQQQRSTGISLLRGMMEELNDPALGGGIILLVLRFASEFMNRAAVFFVKRDEIAGLGQFGIDDLDGDSKVRNLRIPRKAESLFRSVIESRLPLKIKPDNTEWNLYLLSRLGGVFPAEVFLGPVISEGKVVAILYGDNLPEMKAIGDTDVLEIFLSQAGLAMEKALLLRRLKDSSTEGA